jgi:hypothetical protein
LRKIKMDLKSWYKKRGPKFIWHRGIRLLSRYSFGSNKAIQRIKECVASLVGMGCAPTLLTPGMVVDRYPQFIQSLQQLGAEIAVHSYHHVNLSEMPVSLATQQLLRAIRSFERFGIENRGFRCPYLAYSNELLNSLPSGMFDYSSNEALLWDVVDHNNLSHKGIFFEALEKFYKGRNASESVCLPSIRSNMVEIPICVPDDLQLHDGLLLNDEDMEQVWARFLEQTFSRGELFNLIFHTELASCVDDSFVDLLNHAKQLQPMVWIARLRDISEWWREKFKFRVEITSNLKELKLTFDCSPRATILVRGLDLPGSGLMWDGTYSRWESNTLEVPANPRPFIGLADGIPERIISFLREQGYILDTGETARFCGLILNTDELTKLPNDVALINYIEASPAPLVRYWRWPNGAKSALSITGDLDALSLMDYASRLFI